MPDFHRDHIRQVSAAFALCFAIGCSAVGAEEASVQSARVPALAEVVQNNDWPGDRTQEVSCYSGEISDLDLKSKNEERAQDFGPSYVLPVFSIEMGRVNFLRAIMDHAEQCSGSVDASLIKYIADLPKEAHFLDFYAAYSIYEEKCENIYKPTNIDDINEAARGHFVITNSICLGRDKKTLSVIEIRRANFKFIDWSLNSDPGRKRERAAWEKDTAVTAAELLRSLTSNEFETLTIPKYPELTDGTHGSKLHEPFNHYSVCGSRKRFCLYIRFEDIYRNIEDIISNSDQELSEDLEGIDYPRYQIIEIMIYIVK